jgi:SAM-dependent methyltransferase
MEAIEYETMHQLESSFWWYRALHNIILDRIDRMHLPATTRLLDAGCGTGGFLQKLHQAFPAYQLTGLEYHAEGMRHLRELSNMTIINGNVNHMPFPDNSFDALTLTDVLYHKNIDPDKCLSECFRVLVPQGHLLINVSAYNWMRSAHDKHVHTRERYTAGHCKQQLLRAGFKIQHVGYWNSLLFPLMVIHRMTTGQLKEASDIETLASWHDNLLYRIIHSEQFLQRNHIHLPFGGSVWAWATKT